MQHRSLDEIRDMAVAFPPPAAEPPRMSRRERLERWAVLLEQHPEKVRTLDGTEYQPQSLRRGLRAGSSPLTVAFADPLLRAEGLTDDTYGEARRFFSLSDAEAHYVLCSCHFEERMVSAQRIADRARQVAGRSFSVTRSLETVGWIIGTSTAFAAAAVALLLAL